MQFELQLVCNNCCINSIAVKIITIFIRTSFLKQENNQFEPKTCIFKWVSPLQFSKNIKYKIFLSFMRNKQKKECGNNTTFCSKRYTSTFRQDLMDSQRLHTIYFFSSIRHRLAITKPAGLYYFWNNID